MTRQFQRALFALAAHAPWVLTLMRRPVVRGVPHTCPNLRRAIEANAARIFDGPPPPNFTGEVIGQFYDFVREVARAQHESLPELQARVGHVHGREAYAATRAAGRGCVLATAHMGAFEVGLAELRRVEPAVHVVFKRDAFDGFETLRRRLRDTLGVHEAAIDDGWPTLVKLRDALRDNAVVVMQADRALPGQKSATVPFLRGRLRVPLGPVKLAQAAGSPLVPVFTVRTAPGRCDVFLEPAIDPHAPDAVERLGDAVATFVARFPDQWLVLHRAFVEDEPCA